MKAWKIAPISQQPADDASAQREEFVGEICFERICEGTAVGALGGLLFGFDTAVIAGTTEQLTEVFHLTPIHAWA